MKRTITHFPPNKQQELETILAAILHMARPQMVILFGSHSRGDWQDHRYTENGTTYEYKSDFDILVVLKREKRIPVSLSNNIRKMVGKKNKGGTPLSLIFHGIDFLNKELEEGNYFFADIVKEGTLLYDSGNYQLAEAKEMSPIERANKAKVYFDSWFESANRFLETYAFHLEKEYFPEAIFMLHQATERYYMTILLVFTDYKPKIHEIDLLGKETEMLDVRFKAAFPKKTAEEQRLFLLLKRAYIDSRYKLGYAVSKEDLEWLAGRVQKLKELTEAACLERIEQMGKEDV